MKSTTNLPQTIGNAWNVRGVAGSIIAPDSATMNALCSGDGTTDRERLYITAVV